MRLKVPFLSFLLFIFFFGFFSVHSTFAASFTLSGKVTDSSSNPIVGVTVSVNDTNNDSTTTDSSGNYSLIIPQGTYNVQVTPQSGSNFSSAVAVNESINTDTVINFVLVPSGTVTLNGRVLDGTGHPLANQTVAIAPSGTSNYTSFVTDGLSFIYSLRKQKQKTQMN